MHDAADRRGDAHRQIRTIEGSLCPKGQAGIQALYDPYRIVKVLKRAGKRGENKWKSVPFEQAVDEIVNGGNLFGEGRWTASRTSSSCGTRPLPRPWPKTPPWSPPKR